MCVIPHLCKYVFGNNDGNHVKQFNNVIKVLFHGISDDSMHYTPDKFWSEYNYFNHKNGPFGGGYFVWRSKDIQYSNSLLFNQKYYLPYKKVIGFVACRGVCVAERS